MTARPLKTVEAKTAAQWRAWLAKHHDSALEVWLVFHKAHTSRPSVAYDDAVNEALCFGWIDSLIKRLDDARYARKFTPRKTGSRWSAANLKRFARLQAAGRLKPAGLRVAPTDRSGYAPRPPVGRVPRYIQQAIGSHAVARTFFESLAPSYRRLFVLWIDSAKRTETKMKRVQEAVRVLAAGQELGLK